MNKHRRSRKAIITTLGLRPSVKEEFGAFRKALFVDRLGWGLKLHGNVEVDEFDTESTVYCLIHESDKIISGFRAYFPTPLPRSAISESMCAWIGLICSA